MVIRRVNGLGEQVARDTLKTNKQCMQVQTADLLVVLSLYLTQFIKCKTKIWGGSGRG